MSSSPKILRASTKYRWLIMVIFLAMVLLGWLFLQMTQTYIQDLKQLSQHAPEQALNKSSFLLVFISMMAGFPAVGIGTYFLYQGNQIRRARQYPSPGTRVLKDTPVLEGTPAIMRGQLIMGLGGFVVVSGLGLPLVALWLMDSF